MYHGILSFICYSLPNQQKAAAAGSSLTESFVSVCFFFSMFFVRRLNRLHDRKTELKYTVCSPARCGYRFTFASRAELEEMVKPFSFPTGKTIEAMMVGFDFV